MSCTHTPKSETSGSLQLLKHENLQAGQFVVGHKHNFDHTTIIFKGSIKIVTPTRSVVFTAPDHVLIKKEVEHEILILEDDTTYWCVFSHRDENGEVVQEPNGNIDAYGIVN